MSEIELSVTQLACPMPLIRIKKAIMTMQEGDQLTVVGDDPIFEDTVKDFCTENGHEIVSRSQDGRKITFVIKINQVQS